MKQLSKRISLQFIGFVLVVITALIAILGFSFSRGATEEYTKYLDSKKNETLKWFIEVKRDLKTNVDNYLKTGEIPADQNLLVYVSDDRFEVILNNLFIDDTEIKELESHNTGFKTIGRDLIYFNVIFYENEKIIAGTVFDKEKVEELSNSLGEDAIAFLAVGDQYVVPQSFSETNIYVRSVIDLDKQGQKNPFSIREEQIGFSLTPFIKPVYLVDKVSLTGAEIYILQSQKLLVLLGNRLVLILIGIVILIFCFSLVFFIGLNSYISKSLSAILNGFEAIKKGTFEKISIRTSDELGKIAQELNNTMNFIESTLRRLKKSNNLLRKVSREAQQASKMKSEFVANMSHEMRTPMNAILGFTELLLSEEDDEEKQKYLSTIYRSGQHLLTLINDVLDLSKIESDHFEIINNPYSPTGLSKELIETYLPMAYSKGVHLASSVDENVPVFVIGDEFRVRQILTNIISNALKFTERGYVTLIVNYSKEKIKYVVQDTGIGVAQKDVERIFDRFTQTDGTMSRRFGGTGLGLTITKKLTELMNGTLVFDSREGRGTKVTIELPGKLPKNMEFEGIKENKICKKGHSILVFSRDVDFLELVASILSRYEIIFETTSELDKVERLIGERGYSVLMVDIQNNFTEIKKLMKAVGIIPSIAFNSGSVDKTELAFLFNSVIDKPLYQEDLLKTISKYVRLESRVIKPDDSLLLLVEDNQANQILIKKILEMEGFSVDTAMNGKEAINKLANNVYDLVLMDMQMPIMDGYEATKAAREMGIKVPIVALTAHTMRGDEEKTMEAGCDGFLGKPVKRNDLLDTVRYHIGIYKKITEKGVKIPLHVQKNGALKISKEDNAEVKINEKIKEFSESMGFSFDEAKKMFLDYGEFMAESLENMGKFLSESDLKSLLREGHSLKGSGKMYCIDEISEVGIEIEEAARAAQESEIEKLLVRLELIIKENWN